MTAGMDEQYRALDRFQKDLIDFNDRLKTSVNQLEDAFESVSPLWQHEEDEMRREFDGRWDSFRESILRYVQRDGPSYVEWITIKLHATAVYLGL